jgi:sugar/nucleoside kinase (ribokinase family)
MGRPAIAPRRSAAADGLAALGDLLLDVVVRAERPVEVGTDVRGTVRHRAGGSAANVARCYARLGGHAVFIGAVGRDGLGRRLAAALRDDGVDAHVVRVSLPTGRLAALVDERAERSFVTDRGAADLLEPGHLRVSWLRRCAALHLPAYSLLAVPLAEAAAAAARMAHERAMLVSVDLSSRAPIVAAGRERVWRRIEGVTPALLFATVEEATALLGRHPVTDLLALARVVVVKDGAAGCRVLWRDEEGAAGPGIVVAAEPIRVGDTTGAGDAFAAGFLRVLVAARTGPWTPVLLRRAALGGHRAAASLLRRPRPELCL